MVEVVSERWQEPDHGIWEERLLPQHHVHSKVMCWMTVDRAIALSRSYLENGRAEWERLRAAIARDVLEHGWKPGVGAFTGTYEGDELDAAALTIGLVGLLPPSDERYVATVRAVESRLRRGPTVYRYRKDDGLPGFEGGFHICTGWLVKAYLAVGREKDAQELYRAMVALAGPTGLFSEQYGPTTRRALGNFPQGYSHAALIDCALALTERAPAGRPDA
jgi:GH15 family glucan-1,4-alpha-glucosidase